jgi:uncharacterized protein (DUF1778 family)
MSKAPQMGRPPLPAKERKAHMFRIRMTQAERDEIDRAAEAQGETASEWARVLLLKSARRVTR